MKFYIQYQYLQSEDEVQNEVHSKLNMYYVGMNIQLYPNYLFVEFIIAHSLSRPHYHSPHTFSDDSEEDDEMMINDERNHLNFFRIYYNFSLTFQASLSHPSTPFQMTVKRMMSMF